MAGRAIIENMSQKLVREFPSRLISGYETLTPAKLIEIAGEMTKAGIESIDLEVETGYEGDHSVICRERRLETDKEQEKRIAQDKLDAQRREDYERATWTRLQQKFGK